MKTKTIRTPEQNKQSVIDYLTKCSKHTFVRGMDEWRKINVLKEELKDFVKIFIKDDGFEIYEFGKVRKITNEDIDKMVEIFKSNSKNQVKMSIFVYHLFSIRPYSNTKLFAIRNTKYTDSKIKSILNIKHEKNTKVITEENPITKPKESFFSKIFNWIN